jgi:hypothetical protein
MDRFRMLDWVPMITLLFLGGFALVGTAIFVQLLPRSVTALLPGSEEQVKLPSGYMWGALLAVLAFNVAGYDDSGGAWGIGIGLGIFCAAVCASLFVALPAAKRTFFAWVALAIGVLASLAFGFRANGFVQSVNAVTVALSALSLLLLHAADHIEWNAPWLLRTALLYPAAAVRRLPGTFRLLRSSKVSRLSTVLRVAAITVVLVLFFAAILSSADPIFAQRIRLLQEQIVPRAFWSLALACVLALGVASTFSGSYTYRALPLKFLSWIEAAVPVGAVCVLFGVFLSVQARYLFASHESFQAFDLTYAEYVRKGMIELLVATACAGVLSYVVSLKERETESASQAWILRGVNAVLLVELFLMLASALRRDWLYMDVYGLTRVRIVGEIFLAWLACVIVIIAAFALWKRLQEKAVFAGVIAVSFGVVLYLNASNMDLKIASATPPAGQRVDTYYLSLLSVDAVDQWQAAINDMAVEFEGIRTQAVPTEKDRAVLASIVRSTQELMALRNGMLLRVADGPWTAWRWSDARAAETMSGATAFRVTLPCLYDETNDYRWLRDVDIAQEVASLQYDYSRPFVDGADTYDYGAVASDGTVASCL